MSTRLIHLLILLMIAGLFRLLFHVAYLPWWTGDSAGYADPAALLYHGQITNYDGARTPGYPLFLFLCEVLTGADMTDKLTPLAGQIVAWMQTILGLASVALLYLTLQRLQIRSFICFVVTAVYALLASVAQFEMIILSESLSLFCLLLSVYLLAWLIDRLRKNRPVFGASFLAGLAAGATILVRPNLIFIWALFLIALPLAGLLCILRRLDRPRWPILLTISGLCAAGGLLLVVACMSFNYVNTNHFELTSMPAVTRSSAVYNLFSRVHPQDRVLGGIMEKYYRQTNQGAANDRDYIWQAMPEIWAHYHEMPIPRPTGRFRSVEFSNYVGSVSNYLMWEQPHTWLRNSLEQLPATCDFLMPHTVPDDKRGDPISLTGTPVVRNASAWKACATVAGWEAPLLTVTYLLTIFALIIGAVKFAGAPDFPIALSALFSFTLALGSILSMIILCLLGAYCNRYSLPLFPEFMICSAYVIETLLMASKTSTAKIQQARAQTNLESKSEISSHR